MELPLGRIRHGEDRKSDRNYICCLNFYWNTVNERPLIYLEDIDGAYITYAGQVILVKCENNNEGVWLQSSDNNIISNNTCENNDEGIHLRFSQNNTITNNIYEDNSYGIYLYHVPDSLIANNMCRGNTFGIYLKYQSSNNTIYLNNFINNVKNVYYAKFIKAISREKKLKAIEKISPNWEEDMTEWEYWEKELEEWKMRLEDILMKS